MASRLEGLEGNDDLEPLTPIDLDDPEIGVRTEDRYAAIPPGPKLIRRRVHDESHWAPLWLLLALAALLLLGALVARGSDDADRSAPPDARPGIAAVEALPGPPTD